MKFNLLKPKNQLKKKKQQIKIVDVFLLPLRDGILILHVDFILKNLINTENFTVTK